MFKLKDNHLFQCNYKYTFLRLYGCTANKHCMISKSKMYMYNVIATEIFTGNGLFKCIKSFRF